VAGTVTSSAIVPGEMLAQKLVRDAEGVLPRAAELAGVIGDAGVDHDAVAGPDPRHAGADTTPRPPPHRPHHVRESAAAFPDAGRHELGPRWFSAAARMATRTSPCLGEGGVGNVGDFQVGGRVRARGGENAGSHYGRNVGVTICSVPGRGIGTGVPDPTGWMYTL